uniref:C2H2-type domain-containing protein n=1 Tax=Heterorhabditis bacteriophora TaxID=37862 RepID=A0A1I7WJB3_HETBA
MQLCDLTSISEFLFILKQYYNIYHYTRWAKRDQFEKYYNSFRFQQKLLLKSGFSIILISLAYMTSEKYCYQFCGDTYFVFFTHVRRVHLGFPVTRSDLCYVEMENYLVVYCFILLSYCKWTYFPVDCLLPVIRSHVGFCPTAHFSETAEYWKIHIGENTKLGAFSKLILTKTYASEVKIK